MPTGTNPWNYNELPQHLKDYMAKNPYSYTKNGKTYNGADAFNMSDRKLQDYLISSWDTRHLQNSIIANNNAARENTIKKNWEPYGGQYDSSAPSEYYSNGIRKDAWKTMGYQAPNGMKDPVQISNGTTTLWYDRSYGKPAGEYQQSQPSANTPRPRTAVSGTMTYARPLTRMQQAIQKGVSKGKIRAPKNSAILNQMGYPSGGSAQTQQLNISSSQLQQLYNNLNRTSQSADFNGDGIMDNVSIVPGTSQVKVSFGGGGAYQY